MKRDAIESAEQAKELADELSALSKKQSETLQIAAYAQLPKEEAEKYDKRRTRIQELCTMLGKSMPK
jgi:hypothetical protein